jgi:tRNA(fMet)-specific endonuclease VapC
MIRFLFDTDTCVDLIRAKTPRALDRVRSSAPGALGLSSVTLAELEYGIIRSSDAPKNRQALAEFLLPLLVLPFDAPAAAAYGIIRAALETKGLPIGAMDLMIAAHAVSQEVTLVTRNRREFERVPGLRVVSWT